MQKAGLKNIEINMVTVKDFAAKVGRNLTWLFLIAFFVLVALEVLEIKNSVDIALNLNQVLPTKAERSVRINFDGYKAAIDRINDTENFYPAGGVSTDPFSVPIQNVAN